MLIKSKVFLVVFFCFLLILTLFSCGSKSDDSSKKASYSEDKGIPPDYFPTAIGTTWKYKITLGEAEPLNHRNISWPMDEEGGVMVESRGRFFPVVKDSTIKTFNLTISVKAPAPTQGPLKYPLSVELTVEEDELGIFEYSKQIFWAIAAYSKYEVMEVITYSAEECPSAPTGGLWGGWDQEDGYSMRMFFFGEKPGIQIGLGKEPNDKLLFVGLEGNKLHFIRTVDASKRESDVDREASLLDKGFIEETWFEKGKGLVRLVQEQDGKIAMTWELVSFTKGI